MNMPDMLAEEAGHVHPLPETAGQHAAAYHPSVLPDAPERRKRDEELQEALDAAQAAPDEGGPATGRLPRSPARSFFRRAGGGARSPPCRRTPPSAGPAPSPGAGARAAPGDGAGCPPARSPWS